jgi:hypothetical protein
MKTSYIILIIAVLWLMLFYSCYPSYKVTTYYQIRVKKDSAYVVALNDTAWRKKYHGNIQKYNW